MVSEPDWGKELSRFITATEARIASYKKLVQEQHKLGDRELIDLFKSFQKDEEKWLRRLRLEKTAWNEGRWFFLSELRE